MKSLKIIFNLILFLSILFLSSCINSIQAQNEKFITGKIFNSETKEEIPFATIQLIVNKIGVISNSNGDFKLTNIPEFKTDSISIRSIGFQNKKFAFDSLQRKEGNVIFLDPAIFKLEEITVKAKKKRANSIKVIDNAIKNIKNNYPQHTFNTISYYRDYQKYNTKLANMNEALIYAEDGGFNTNSLTGRFRLLDFKKNSNFQTLNISLYYDTLNFVDKRGSNKIIPHAKLFDITGNELIILLVHDAIRNFNSTSFSFVNQFSRDFINNHRFKKPEIIMTDKLILYKIGFYENKMIAGNKYQVNGAIYIQPESYAIYKLEYSCSYANNKNEWKPLFNITTEYDNENTTDSLMRLKYISFNNIFEIADPNDSTSFQVLKFYRDQNDSTHSTLTLEFNRIPDYTSASTKGNYSFLINNKAIKLKEIIPNGRFVNLVLEYNVYAIENKKCTVVVDNVTDLQGNLINRRKTVELVQYRELFVQEYDKKIHFYDNNYLKPLPLEKNKISEFEGDFNYWMNTPEINDIEN